MYLPGVSSRLLPFFQLPLSLLSSDQPSLHPITNEDIRVHNDVNILGAISPYHDAPTVPGISAELPHDCTVDRVVLLQRHGSRGPSKLGIRDEPGYIHSLVYTLHDASDKIQAANLPPELEFLKEGYEDDLVPNNLTVVGRQELFNHGIDFALRYPTFKANEVVTTGVPRVIESAYFFIQGFFGREVDDIKYLGPKDFSDPVFWLLPWTKCSKLGPNPALRIAERWVNDTVPRIQQRFNRFIPGVEFSLDDVRGALYACPYDLAARDKSPWCNVFTETELRGLEYELDLYYDNFTGHWHDSQPDAGPFVGAFYVKKLIERLTDASENAKNLYLDFAHDVTILLAMSTMNLNKDNEPLSPLVDTPPTDRKFRTSDQTPFAAQMVWERFACTKSFGGRPQVRLLLNGATFPLSVCDMDEQYGTCSLEAFVDANAFSMGVEYQGDAWNATC